MKHTFKQSEVVNLKLNFIGLINTSCTEVLKNKLSF